VRFWNLTASARIASHIDQLPGDLQAPIVVDPRLGDDVRGMLRPDDPITDADV
jgi:hypothetical protein